MKRSLRGKIIYLLTGLIVFTLLLMWLLNKTFLVDYYLYSKMKSVDNAYSRVMEIYNEDELLSSEGNLELQRLASNENINIYIFGKSRVYIFTNHISSNYSTVEDGQREINQVNSLIKEYWYAGSNPDIRDRKPLKNTQDYTIYKLFDEKVQSNYLDLVNEDRTLILRTNFESMQESVAISSKFSGYIGVLAMLVGGIIIIIGSKRFTSPILELADIAKRMADLDFDVKYEVKSMDELGTLGTSINVLSERLEQNILKLKTANNELHSDIKKKNKIDEMRREFLSNVSHELKTPISLIQGYAEGLKENINDDAESRESYCGVIIDEANKMDDMVKKLLSLNNIEFGNDSISIERFDIVELVKSILDSSQILMKKKNVFLRYEEKEPVYVWSDPYLIQDVLQNYINNGINHASKANIIEVKVIKIGQVVRVAVFNTGDQIPEEELDKIWDKFYKVDKARTREYGGSGIGLSIVKAIMNSLNQECGVNNRKNGVEFWFEVDTSI